MDHRGDARAVSDAYPAERSLDTRVGGEIDADAFRCRRRMGGNLSIEADQTKPLSELLDHSRADETAATGHNDDVLRVSHDPAPPQR